MKGSEVGPRAPGFGVSADHELLMPLTLELQPFPGAPGRVTAVRALADDALQAILPGGAIEVLAAFENVFRVLDHAPVREKEGETLFPLRQGERTEVPFLGLQAIEEHSAHRHRPRRSLDVEPMGQVHPPLESLEARPAAVVHGDDLAIDEKLSRSRFAQRVNDLRISHGDVVALAAQESHGVVAALGEDADAVVFDLEKPVRVGEGGAPG